MMDPLAAYRILLWHANHDPICLQGVSEAALREISDFLRDAEHCDPADFDRPPQGKTGARKKLRFLCALIPLSESSLAEAVRDMVGNPGLTVRDVAEIIGEDQKERPGSGYDYPGSWIQEAGVLLRQGLSKYATAGATDVNLNTVTQIAKFLGTDEAREEAYREHAFQMVEAGEKDPLLLTARTRLPLKRAQALLREVEEGLAESEATA